MKQLLVFILISVFASHPAFSQEDSLLLKLSPRIIKKNLPETPGIFENVTDIWAKEFKYREIVDLGNRILINTDSTTNKALLSSVYNTLGLNYWKLGELDSALVFLEKSAAIRRELNNPRSIGIAYNNLGVLYWKKGNYERAYLNYSQALEYREKAKDFKGVVLVLNNLGLIYQRLKYYDFSEEAIRKALRIADSINYDFGIGYSHRRLANLCLEQEKYDCFYENANKAVKIFEASKSIDDIGEIYNDFGRYYVGKKQFPKAVEYYEKSLEISIQIKDKFLQANSLFYLGELNYKTGNFNKAISNSNQSLELSIAKDYRVISGNNYLNLSNIYKEQNNNTQSLFYLEKYLQIKDSILNQTVISNISEANIKQIIMKSEESKRLLIKENELQQQKIDYQQKINIAYIVIILIILAALILIINLYFKQGKLQKSIAETNVRLGTLNQELNQKNSELEKANNTKQKLFSIIAHDLKNPFVSIYGFAELIRFEALSLKNKEISELSGTLLESSEKIVQLIDNLTKWSLLQENTLAVTPVEFDLAKELRTINTQLKLNAELKNIQINTQIPETAIVFADSEMISTVIRNILSNAIKFSNKNGKIDIKAEMRDSFIDISIADNGVGMSDELKERILKGDKINSSLGTSFEKGTGIGLSICREFVQLNKGKLDIQTAINEGSVFTISIPTRRT